MGIDVWHFLMVLGVVTHGRWRPLVAYKPFARFAAVIIKSNQRRCGGGLFLRAHVHTFFDSARVSVCLSPQCR